MTTPDPLNYARLRDATEAAVATLNGYLPSHRISFDNNSPGYEPITDPAGLMHYEAQSDESRRKGYTPCVKVRIGHGRDEAWLADIQIDDVATELLNQIAGSLDLGAGAARELPKTRIGPKAGKFQGEFQLGISPKGNLLLVATFNEYSARGQVEVEGRNWLMISPDGARWPSSRSVLRASENQPEKALATAIREFISEFDIHADAAKNPIQKVEALLRLPQFNPAGCGLKAALKAGELTLAYGSRPPDALLLRKLGHGIALAFRLKPEQPPSEWPLYGLAMAATDNGAWRLSTLIEGHDPATKAHHIGKSWTVVAGDLSASASGQSATTLAPHLDTFANIRAQIAEADARMRAAIIEFELAQGRPVKPGNTPATPVTNLDSLPMDPQGTVALPLARIEFRALSRTLDGGVRVIAHGDLVQSSEIARLLGFASNQYGHFKVSPERLAELPGLARQAGLINSVKDARVADPEGQPLIF